MSNKTSDAQIKAVQKYNAKATKTVLIRLNLEKDKDIIEHLENQKSMMGYIKELIRLDMKEPSLSCHIVYNRIKACHDCNDCGNYGCGYDPDPGETTRINCPLWEEQK